MNRGKLIRERQSEVRALEKEYIQLQRAYREREWIKLEKPLRNGWCKHLQLKPSIRETKNGELFQAICDMISWRVGGTLREDCEKRWQRRLHHEGYIRIPGMRGISRREIKKLPAAARQYFMYYGYRYGYRSEKVFLCMLSKHYFEEVYSRAYITHRRPVDAETVKRIAEIDELLLSDKYFKHSWHANTYRWRDRNRSKSKREVIRKALAELEWG